MGPVISIVWGAVMAMRSFSVRDFFRRDILAGIPNKPRRLLFNKPVYNNLVKNVFFLGQNDFFSKIAMEKYDFFSKFDV